MKPDLTQKDWRRLAFPLSACLIVLLSVFGPEALARYKDKHILGEIHAEAVDAAGEGYRYTLNANEKVYILSCCLSSQVLPESELNALTRPDADTVTYPAPEGNYAFVVNRRGPSGKEITKEEIYQTCNDGIASLQALGVLPEGIREVDEASYDATLYSAIDIPEPANNVSVWKVSLSTSQKNTNRENRLIDAYIDADTGTIYEFYVRTELTWDEINPDFIIEQWRSYMGLTAPEVLQSDNPLLETTPYFKKYVCSGRGEESTIVTVGFYEGIQELFLKISK